jgi:hypothetical protein
MAHMQIGSPPQHQQNLLVVPMFPKSHTIAMWVQKGKVCEIMQIYLKTYT